MTPEEARRHIEEQTAELRRLEAEVARLAASHAVAVFMAITRALVETVCGRDGAHFATLYKIRFYAGVLRMLADKGIR